jgi:hypothetical protein
MGSLQGLHLASRNLAMRFRDMLQNAGHVYKPGTYKMGISRPFLKAPPLFTLLFTAAVFNSDFH